MFSLFESFFSAITSAVASVFVAVSLVLSPAVPEEPIVVVRVEEEMPGGEGGGVASEDAALLSEVEKLREEIAALKKSSQEKSASASASVSVPVVSAPAPSPAPAPIVSVPPPVSVPSSPTPKTLTLPSGVVVELDADGNVVQDEEEVASTQTQAGTKTVTLPSGITIEVDSSGNVAGDYAGNIVTLPNGSVVELGDNGEIIRYLDEAGGTSSNTGGLQITSVSISEKIHSARFTWQTSKSTQSKVIVSGGGLSQKEFSSTKGTDTSHAVTIDSLDEGTEYSYEIEATAGDVTVEESGTFQTKPVRVKGTPYVYILDSSDEHHIYFETDPSSSVTTSVEFVDTSSSVFGTFSTSGFEHEVKLGSAIEDEIKRLLDEGKNSAIEVEIKFDTSKGTTYDYTLATDNPAIKF